MMVGSDVMFGAIGGSRLGSICFGLAFSRQRFYFRPFSRYQSGLLGRAKVGVKNMLYSEEYRNMLVDAAVQTKDESVFSMDRSGLIVPLCPSTMMVRT